MRRVARVHGSQLPVFIRSISFLSMSGTSSFPTVEPESVNSPSAVRMGLVAIVLSVFIQLTSDVRAIEFTSDAIVDFRIPVAEGTTYVRQGSENAPHVQFVDGAELVWLRIEDASRVTVRGGIFHGAVAAFDSSTVDFFAGAIDGEEDLELYGSSVANIHGGAFTDDLDARDSSTLNVFGGNFLKALDGGELSASDVATVNVYGFDLMLLPGRDHVDERYQFLTGTLMDGSRVEMDVFTQGSGQIRVHNVPEPAATVELLLALLFTIPFVKRSCVVS